MRFGMLRDMSEQVAVRLPDELARELDRLVRSGAYPTKAEAIRSAIETLVEQARRRAIGEAIAEGYVRIPQGETDDVAGPTAASTRETLAALEAEEEAGDPSW